MLQRNKVMREVAVELETLAAILPECTIDFYSNSSEVLKLLKLAKKLRDGAND